MNFAAANYSVLTMTEKEILTAVKTFAVAPVAISTEAAAPENEGGTDRAEWWKSCSTTHTTSSSTEADASLEEPAHTFDLSSPPMRMTTALGRWTVEGLCPANISDETVVSTTAGEWRHV